ncbi:hypothetical protein CAPTEDRAFT_228859 [Capitella teleta]|uniref:STAGA complex 65 subunit gamma n=1 Tax=Capitella teleta TaxID=283909 RepID=R7T4Y4_CAPTE|nr:hypothetical protein CAPTEDRAFT_228859 [Capitella teleta]|eukprot:ELT88177.1 hypothetical protein CAPTEDRAFT_228859 [Capitella teleta]
MTTSDLWGEIPVTEETLPAVPQQELELIMKPRPIEVEGPLLHQPSSRPAPPTNEPLAAQFASIDHVTLHTIQLLQYSRKLRSQLMNMQNQIESMQLEGKAYPQFSQVPVIPEYKGAPIKHPMQKPLPFLSKEEESDFARGIGEAPPELSPANCRKLLKQSVAAILAHTGFDVCSESILDMMTDVVHEYMLRFTRTMRHARDDEALYGSAGFPDVMERVFYEMGQGPMLGLHDFYQSRVIRYHDNLLRTCQLLRDDYVQLQNADYESLQTLKRSYKAEMPDIHFSAIEETNGDFDGCIPLEATIWPGVGMNSLTDPGDNDPQTADVFDVTESKVSIKTEDDCSDSTADLLSPKIATQQPPFKKKKS